MSFKAHIAHLPDGNDICYMDSGPVEGSSKYTTIVMLHGLGFNSHVFERVHPKAAQYGLRTIAVQRKDYSGSSEYTDAELMDLHHGNPAHLDRLAVLLGHLIQHLIRTHDIPEPNEERTEGGIVLLGWSIGSATAISILSNARLFGQEQYNILRHYLIKLIFFDPPFVAFGFKEMGVRGQPMLSDTVEGHFDRFRFFVSSYYDNPDPWDGSAEKLDQRPRTDNCSVDSWTQDRWDKIYQLNAALSSELPTVLGPMQMTLWEFTQYALCDEDNANITFPGLPILHVVCQRSLRHTPWAYQCMRELHQERKDNGQFMRPITYKEIKGAHHLLHWDSPDSFLEIVAKSVRERE